MEYSLTDIMETINRLKEKYPDEMRKILGSEENPDKKGNVAMGKAFRKPVPSPPNWYWADTDNCYGCKNKNNCNGCSLLKANRSEQREKQKRAEKGELRKYVYG